MRVAVIIPFFQRQPGLLRRAVTSILRQKLPEDLCVDIIVIDDGSPLPAETDLTGLDVSSPFELKLIRKENGGVSSARNAGLDQVSDDAFIIAFLDSDDYWTEDHLSTATKAFSLGADFFFCDSKREDDLQSSFAQKDFSAFIARRGKVAEQALFELDQASFYDQSLRGRMFLTPAVAYRRAIKPAHRFDESLRFAGEDCLYFFELVAASGRIFCSTGLHVICGKGVNIHAGKFGWDNPANLSLHMAHLLAFKRCKEILPLSPKQKVFITKRIHRVRALLAFLSIRLFLKRRRVWPQDLRAMVRSDRQFVFWYPLYAIYVVCAYPIKLYDPTAPW
jgi:succinoglycan biosynthesis protein ExoW